MHLCTIVLVFILPSVISFTLYFFLSGLDLINNDIAICK